MAIDFLVLFFLLPLDVEHMAGKWQQSRIFGSKFALSLPYDYTNVVTLFRPSSPSSS
jgi:hypothetical protein